MINFKITNKGEYINVIMLHFPKHLKKEIYLMVNFHSEKKTTIMKRHHNQCIMNLMKYCLPFLY